jgi:hypothetical protein
MDGWLMQRGLPSQQKADLKNKKIPIGQTP